MTLRARETLAKLESRKSRRLMNHHLAPAAIVSHAHFSFLAPPATPTSSQPSGGGGGAARDFWRAPICRRRRQVAGSEGANPSRAARK